MKKIAFASLLTLGLFALPAFGLEGKVSGQEIPALQYALDTVWVIFAAVLVFFMQAGFAMVETGLTRAKNAVNIMMKNFMDFSMGSIAYWAVGFGLMFGVSTTGFFGTTGLWLGPISIPMPSRFRCSRIFFFRSSGNGTISFPVSTFQSLVVPSLLEESRSLLSSENW